MRMCFVQLALALALLCVPPQTQAQEVAKPATISFGTIVEAYEFQPGFILTVSRDSDGRPIELIVHKATLAGRGHPENT